jgi:hypothetical protein
MRFERDTQPAVSNWGNCQPTLWIAGTSPINRAESVIWETKSGMIVMKEANPSAKPKNRRPGD